MTDDNPSQALEALRQAKQALRLGNIASARHWVALATRLDPNLEGAWLILAAISSPQESLVYLKRALEINPQSHAARQGVHWAIRRLRQQSHPSEAASAPLSPPSFTETQAPQEALQEALPPEPTQPTRVEPVPSRPPEAKTQPVQARVQPAAAPVVKPRPSVPPTYTRVSQKALERRTFRLASRPFFAMILVVLVLSTGLAAWIGAPQITQALAIDETQAAPRQAAYLVKPTFTPTNTPTPTPTPTATPTPTNTPTSTPTPTVTPTPTDTPTPTPTDTPIATPTPTRLSLDNIGEGDRWIDIDLSGQRAYAMVGDEVVNSFLVSTGTWAHPTVTGQFHIYVKYRYADMSGPGYFLPDVPYVMYFYKGYGLHGTYWHNNFGTPMSHGCVNFTIDDAGWVYDFSGIGTLVNVHD